MSDLFGARAGPMREQVRRFALGFGLEMTVPERIPWTRPALLLAEHARDRGALHPLRAAVMDAHWRDGLDIEDREVLAGCAAQAGLPRAGALAALDDPGIAARVDRARAEAHRAGVTGIPTIVVGGRRIVGCQPYPVLEAATQAAGAARRAR